MTVRQVAERLGVSQALVYALVSAGKIVHERHGLGRGTIRVSEEALEAYRRSRSVGMQAEEAKGLPPPVRPGRREPRLKRLALD